MYAVIRDQNRQAVVRAGDVILCDLKRSLEPGAAVTFDEVLLVGEEGSVRVGRPTIEGARVTGEVVGMVKGEKLVAFRFKRRKNVRVKRGHRQKYTRVRITGIEA